MIPDAALAELRDILGEDGASVHEPVEVDGASLGVTLRPRDEETLAGALGALGRLGLSVRVRGGGSRDGAGNLPARAHALLSTTALSGIDTFDASDGVCHAGAGTPLADVRAAVEPRGWELPLDPPGPRCTVGGAVAAAVAGPRAEGFGPARDAVLGLEVVLASGERTRCGGRVVKNVTGYDLNKLYTGSWGTLGVIAGGWLRLRPQPERAMVFEAVVGGEERACAAGIEAARRSTTRACALVSEDGDAAFRLVAELAGSEPAVARDADWAAHELAAAEAPVEALDRVRDLQGALPGGDGVRLRFDVLPSKLAPVLAALRASGARLLVYPGRGTAYAGFRPAAGDLFERAARIAETCGASLVCESAPVALRRDRDVFAVPAPALALMRALKERFDPKGVLNPGRFAGGI